MSDWTAWENVDGYELEELLYDKRYRVRDGERCGGVARIRFNRPERMNAFTVETSAQLIEALNEANRDTSIGVIVVSHTGQHFGVGGDVAGLGENVRKSAGMGGITPDTIIKRCLKPVIAVVRGYVIGMHHHMAYHCDFTIAGESAVFGQNGPRVGSPASGFLVASSAHVVGMKRARELWIRCRQLTAQEALERGLCNVVVQDRLLDAETERWCDDLLDRVPICLAAVKQSFEAVDAPLHYSDNFLSMIETDFGNRPEIREAGQSFFEKRPPNFWTDEMIASRF
jgi:naphthoate synthase